MEIKTDERSTHKIRVEGYGKTIFNSKIFGYMSHDFSHIRCEPIPEIGIPPTDLWMQGAKSIPRSFSEMFEYLGTKEGMIYPCVTEQYIPSVVKKLKESFLVNDITLLSFVRFRDHFGRHDFRGIRITFPKKEKPSAFLYGLKEKTNWIHSDKTYLLLPQPIEIRASKSYIKMIKKEIEDDLKKAVNQ